MKKFFTAVRHKLITIELKNQAYADRWKISHTCRAASWRHVHQIGNYGLSYAGGDQSLEVDFALSTLPLLARHLPASPSPPISLLLA